MRGEPRVRGNCRQGDQTFLSSTEPSRIDYYLLDSSIASHFAPQEELLQQKNLPDMNPKPGSGLPIVPPATLLPKGIRAFQRTIPSTRKSTNWRTLGDKCRWRGYTTHTAVWLQAY